MSRLNIHLVIALLLLLFADLIVAVPRSLAMEWKIEVDGALLLDELIQDEYRQRGLRVRDKLSGGAKFLAVRGRVVASDWGEDDTSLKIAGADVTVVADKKQFAVAGNKWSPLHYSTGLSYFTISKPRTGSDKTSTKPFLFVFIVPADTVPTELKILDKTKPIEPKVDRQMTRPAQTATWSVKSSGYVDKFSATQAYRISASSERINAARSIAAAHGKLFGVTIEATPRTGGYKNPSLWHYTFHDMGILVDGRTWTAAVTQSTPEGKGFTSSGGGILIERRDGKWPSRSGTIFFVVPEDMKSFQITVGGDVVASGKVAPTGAKPSRATIKTSRR